VKNKFYDFDEFILWLKKDGLKPKRSERLWRKKIFANLVNEHKKIIDNYNDFLLDKKLKNLIGKKVIYQNIEQKILDITINQKDYLFKMHDQSIIRVQHALLNIFIKNHIKE